MKAMRTALGIALALAIAVPAVGQDKEGKKAEGKKPASLVVKLADEEAQLWVDGEEQDKTGAERTFRTPPLEPGKKYYYILKAKWEPNNYTTITRERKAIVEAGKETVLDMRKADPKQPDDIVIRYVPTPQSFVNEMMELAKVGKDDVVFDLGCGDGRLVVTAVSKYKAKFGVGVDIDPVRIKESNANAKKNEVEDKVEFRIQDVMKIPDLEKATVVTLYLANDLNEQLMPILKKRLRNGARIVSHRFLMGDWEPEKSKELRDGSYKESIHLWIIKKKEDKDKDGDKKDGDKKDKDKDDKKDD